MDQLLLLSDSIRFESPRMMRVLCAVMNGLLRANRFGQTIGAVREGGGAWLAAHGGYASRRSSEYLNC